MFANQQDGHRPLLGGSVRAGAHIVLVTCCITVFAECGTLDSVRQAKVGAETSSYLSSVQPRLEGYGTALSTIDTTGGVSPTQEATFRKAQTDMKQTVSELKDITLSDKYKKAHAKLTTAAEDTSGALGDPADAAKAGDKEASAGALDTLVESQATFGEAMQAVAQPIADVTNK